MCDLFPLISLLYIACASRRPFLAVTHLKFIAKDQKTKKEQKKKKTKRIETNKKITNKEKKNSISNNHSPNNYYENKKICWNIYFYYSGIFCVPHFRVVFLPPHEWCPSERRGYSSFFFLFLVCVFFCFARGFSVMSGIGLTTLTNKKEISENVWMLLCLCSVINWILYLCYTTCVIRKSTRQ